MRSDGYNYKHSITFIMTANTNPLPVEADDRRFAFIKTPNKLEIQDWVKEHGGISAVQDRIKEEVMDFCYYIATEVPALTFDEYVIAPMTKDKERLMLDSMPAVEQISYYIKNSQFEMLKDIAEEHNVKNFDENWEKNKLEDSKLEELYISMTEGQGSHRAVIKALKSLGLNRQHTTRHGQNVYYYFINDLHHFKSSNFVEADFQPQQKANVVKGL
jgi:hypothetical protein